MNQSQILRIFDRKNFSFKNGDIFKTKIIIKEEEFDLLLFNWLSITDLSKSGLKLSPNLLSYIHKNLDGHTKYNVKEHKAYITIKKKNVKFKIRNQDI